jgi:hypothetical protein
MKKNFSIRDKLLKYCELHDMKKNEFHLKAGLSNGFLDKNSGITTDSLAKILRAFPDIDVRWLLVGDELVQPCAVTHGDYINNKVVGDLLGNGATKTTGTIDEMLFKMIEDANQERRKIIDDAARDRQELMQIIKNLTAQGKEVQR